MKYIALCLALALGFSSVATAAVRINEVAWKGTSTSANDEWIELYNDGSAAEPLSGYSLHIDGGLTIALTGTVAAGGYYLLERTDNDTVPGIVADKIYTGALPNTAGTILKLEHNGVVDQVTYINSAWTVPQTMQYIASVWTTADATPKAQNVAPVIPDPEEEEEETDTTEDTQAADIVEEERASSKAPDDDVIVFSHIPAHIAFSFPPHVYLHVPYDFSADVVFDDMRREHGYFVWNMGDGTTIATDMMLPINHTYMQPGTYTIVLAYRNSAQDTDVLLKYMKPVTVETPPVAMVQPDSQSIRLTNTSADVIDLSGWKLHDSSGIAEMPEMTMLAPNASIILPAHAFGLEAFEWTELLSPGGIRIAQAGAAPTDMPAVRHSSSVAARVATVVSARSVAEEPIGNSDDVPAEEVPQTHRRTKVVLGAAAIVGIGLSLLLLERFMVRKEHSG